ncbi:MAG: sigma-70 family RNA polymerase sigma factor [Chloroflexi bacterium]|nr:sigma-70 family RNA polymerase sigma factor [Chloroflexota bacterium]
MAESPRTEPTAHDSGVHPDDRLGHSEAADEPLAGWTQAALVAALRRGDESAFVALVDGYYGTLLRLALLYLPNRTVAEEAVQETWQGVFQSIHRFEGRSTLKTWLFRILTNRAKTRGARESRIIPFSALGESADDDGPAVEPGRFLGPDHPRAPGHWAAPPRSWSVLPEEQLLAKETSDEIHAAIAKLPPSQREVIHLRDVEGWTAQEVCNVLNLSETNQRVLLHRARSKVRAALERYLDTG